MKDIYTRLVDKDYLDKYSYEEGVKKILEEDVSLYNEIDIRQGIAGLVSEEINKKIIKINQDLNTSK